MPEYGLGRWHSPDDRDLNYPLRALLGAESLPKYRYYRTGPVLDQGRTSSCVGQSWRQFLSSAPLMTKTGPDAMTLYREAQKRDPWPGEEPSYYGTSVRAGAAYLTELGHVAEYRWAWQISDIANWLLTRGTIVLGTLWPRSYFYPGADSFVKLDLSVIAGGHAYVAVGYSQPRGAVRCLNSWGRGFGDNGRFWIPGEDLQTLLDRDGEACAALEARA